MATERSKLCGKERDLAMEVHGRHKGHLGQKSECDCADYARGTLTFLLGGAQ